MPQDFTRCQFMDERGIQCDTWFRIDEYNKSFQCPPHRNISGHKHIETDAKRLSFIEESNRHRFAVSEMSLDEIDSHIANIELEMEKLRTALLATRSVRGEKLNKLTEEERAERRKIKVIKTLENGDKPKRVSAKKDPLENLIQTFMKNGLTREVATSSARDILGLD